MLFPAGEPRATLGRSREGTVGEGAPSSGPAEVDAMKLREALLCVECESLYPVSRACPQCGSQVSFPLSRALNRAGPSVRVLAGSPPHEARVRSTFAAAAGSRPSALFQSA